MTTTEKDNDENAEPSSERGQPEEEPQHDEQQRQVTTTAVAAAAAADSSSSSPPRGAEHHQSSSSPPSSNPRKRKQSALSASESSSSSSDSSSTSDDDDDGVDDVFNGTKHGGVGWRVKLYRLNADGTWDDCGTGRISCQYNHNNNTTSSSSSSDAVRRHLNDPMLVVRTENPPPHYLLKARVLLNDPYQRQGDNIITWCHNNEDLALSFQDNAGCLDIWRQLTTVQSRAAEFQRQNDENRGGGGGAQQQENGNDGNMWMLAKDQHNGDSADTSSSEKEQQDAEAEAVAVSMAAAAALAYGKESLPQLPNPPTLSNLEQIADEIASAQQVPQREALAMFISKDDCSYFKSLLSLFPSVEAKGDYGALATLAACIKTILLLNDPSIIEWLVTEEAIYEQVCSALEYDPDLRDKANHRWFLRERAKFRTVVLMEDPELVATIHRSFRVAYLRDTLLRPTMDENSLSTLSSLQAFTHADVVKGVTMPPSRMNGKEQSSEEGDTQPSKKDGVEQTTNGDVPLSTKDGEEQTSQEEESYLVKVLRMLGHEVREIARMECEALEKGEELSERQQEEPPEPSIAAEPSSSTTWKQYLSPQDGSLASRRLRRSGCLSFFRELFTMVRTSLQPNDRDDFYSAVIGMELEDRQKEDSVDGDMRPPINLLSSLSCVLSDPSSDIAEKAAALEIIGAAAMHDPGLIRKHCLDFYDVWKKKQQHGQTGSGPGRPNPNERKQIIFQCGPNDVLASLLFLLAVETDAGLLLQTSEIMRIILDTEMIGDHGPLGMAVCSEDTDGAPPGMPGLVPAEEAKSESAASAANEEQNHFLSLFYEHYVQWLVAPFQYTVLHTTKRMPDAFPAESPLVQRIRETHKNGVASDDKLLKLVPNCAIRSSFAVELMSFCVRAHLYRMKTFLLRSRVLGGVLNLLAPSKSSPSVSVDRCLKLSALRFLRSILSVKDEFYHRHIIQHNLFAPVFEAFRANPVGDNLVSSAIVEMCDFIHTQRIKSLIEYIVTKHLAVPAANPGSEKLVPSLEDVATPYVTTLTKLRKEYEEDLKGTKVTSTPDQGSGVNRLGDNYSSLSLAGTPRVGMSEKALEDQRKFRQADEEESYFDADDDEEEITGPVDSSSEPAEGRRGGDLHRAPRMLSLLSAPFLHQTNGRESGDSERRQEPEEESSESNTRDDETNENTSP